MVPINPTNIHLTAKEERQLYTLKPATVMTTTIPPTCHIPFAPVLKPSLAPRASAVGPVRNQRNSTQARMQTGPMTPALKARILRNIANNTPKDNPAQTTTPPAETGLVTPVEAGSTTSIRTAQHSQSAIANNPFDHQREPPPSSDYSVDDISDDLSFTSSFPDVFDVGMEDSQPSETGPWMIIDHFTGEMVIDKESPSATPFVAGAPFDTAIQVRTILGVPTLVQTRPPALLFEDRDERPDWLIWSTNEFLQHVPYYMCLDKVVDLFFAQEARLGYPEKVKIIVFFRVFIH